MGLDFRLSLISWVNWVNVIMPDGICVVLYSKRVYSLTGDNPETTDHRNFAHTNMSHDKIVGR